MRLSVVSALVAATLLSARSNFNAQVTKVQSLIDMVNTKLAFGPYPGDYEFEDGSEANISDIGAFVASSDDMLALRSVDVYPVSETGETHFQYQLSFSAVANNVTAGPLGTNTDPMYGALTAGIMQEQQDLGGGFFFALTNTKVFAIIFAPNPEAVFSLWAIPIANRLVIDVDTYTIVVKRQDKRVLFRVNNVDKVEVPGYCGIDQKFLIGSLLTSKQAGPVCSPVFAGDEWMATAQNFFWVGPFAMVLPTRGFCQGTTYDMCQENVSNAFLSRCQYYLPTAPFSMNYTGSISGIQVFDIEKTSRCGDESSSSSTFHNWYSQPRKVAGEAIELEN